MTTSSYAGTIGWLDDYTNVTSSTVGVPKVFLILQLPEVKLMYDLRITLPLL
jgi:hypothetical protein